MTDGWLKRAGKDRAGLEAFAAVLVMAIFLVLAGGDQPDATAPLAIAYIDAGTGLETAPPPDGAGWQNLDITEVARPAGVGWLVWDGITIEPDGTPMAVRLSGPFSAVAYFNGVQIGTKGEPGASRSEEVAGPIDARFALPAALIQPGGNRLALLLSSHRAGYAPHTLIQSLSIEPYSADARRSLRYYMPLILLGSAQLALIIALYLRSRAVGDRRGVWLIAAVAGLVLALLGEISRALIDYPYDWHQPRQALILAGLCLFGGALLRYSQLRWPAPAAVRRAWLTVSALAVVAAIVLMTGYDGKSLVAIGLLLISTAGWMVWRGDGQARWLALGVLIMAGFAGWQPGDFLDRSIHALTLTLLAVPAIRHPALWLPEPVRLATQTRLQLQTTGRLTVLELAEIAFLKAAGNYTEVHTVNGGRHLDNRNLRALMESVPARFFRLHRSHAVNLDQAHAITVEAGSRYRLQLKNGAQIPISREMVAETRRQLLSHRTS